MGTPNVDKKNLRYISTSSSGADYTKFTSNSRPGNIFCDTTPFNVSRVRPSNYNIGSNVSKIDYKTGSVFNLGYNKGYFNNNLDLHPLYNTNSLSDLYGGTKRNFWDKLFDGVSKVMSFGMLGFMGFGLVQGIMGLFGKNKTENKGEKVEVENDDNDVKVETKTKSSRSTEQTADVDTSIAESKGLDKSSDTDQLQEAIDELDLSIENAKDELNGIDEKITDKEAEINDLKAAENSAKADYDAKHKAASAKNKEVQNLNDKVENAKQDVEKASKNFQKIDAQYDQLNAQLQSMSPDDPNYAALKEKVAELLRQKNQAKVSVAIAQQTLKNTEIEFGKAADELEILKEDAAELLETYKEAKSETENAQAQLKKLNINKSKLPGKIEKAQEQKQKLESRLEVLNIRENADSN